MGTLEAFLATGLGKLRIICSYVLFTSDVPANTEWFYKVEWLVNWLKIVSDSYVLKSLKIMWYVVVICVLLNAMILLVECKKIFMEKLNTYIVS